MHPADESRQAQKICFLEIREAYDWLVHEATAINGNLRAYNSIHVPHEVFSSYTYMYVAIIGLAGLSNKYLKRKGK